jgi:uncharacterized OB-fold protein
MTSHPDRRTSKEPGIPVGVVQRDAATAEFFAGTQRGELLLRRCAACGQPSRPQARSCAQCRSADLGWEPAAGQGTVVSWSVVHGRAGEGEPPSSVVVAIVELDEGPWLHAQLVDVDPDSVTGGQRVTVGFEQAAGGEAIPVFRPAS